MADESLMDFVRAAFNLGDAARYVINGEAFGHDELMAALAEFAVVNRAMDLDEFLRRSSAAFWRQRHPLPDWRQGRMHMTTEAWNDLAAAWENFETAPSEQTARAFAEAIEAAR
jgi:hypothetical protein